MQLITLAHPGEAQSIIERFKLTKVSDSLYKGEGLACLITGEGPFEAAIRTSAELGREDYQEVINLGICGALSSSLELESIHEVRCIYLAVDGKPQFRSFPVSEKGLDLITSFERILDPKRAEVLRGVGSLVDREAWGVAYACKEARIPFRSFKIISDLAGSLEACELIRERAQFFSQKISDFLEEMLSLKSEKISGGNLELGPEFYFTFSSSHKFSSGLKKLALRRDLSESEVLRSFPIEEIRERKLTPKDRAKHVLELIDDELDPFRGSLKKRLREMKKSWEEKGVRIQTDPQLEDEKIQLNFHVSSNEELQRKLQELSSLDLAAFQKIFKGEINVE